MLITAEFSARALAIALMAFDSLDAFCPRSILGVARSVAALFSVWRVLSVILLLSLLGLKLEPHSLRLIPWNFKRVSKLLKQLLFKFVRPANLLKQFAGFRAVY